MPSEFQKWRPSQTAINFNGMYNLFDATLAMDGWRDISDVIDLRCSNDLRQTSILPNSRKSKCR